jgi:hypothetical protein
MPTELEQRARELLAAEQESAGFPYTAWRIREQIDLTDDEAIAIRAIAAALQAQQPINGDVESSKAAAVPSVDGGPGNYVAPASPPSQQPGAQAVAPEGAVSWQRRIRGDSGKWLAWSEWEDLYGEGKVQKVGRFDCEYRPLYTHPQPTEGTTPVVTIPEPSEADVRASCVEWGVAISSGNVVLFSDLIRSLLTTYTARLRERVGQAPGGDGDA